MRAFAEVELGQDDYDSWHDAEPCLTQPDTAFERIFRMPIWRYYAEHSERGALFGEAMTNLTAIANAGVLGSYQFATFSNAVDVGGGHGSFLAAILDYNPTAQGILFDLPSVIEDAEKAEFIAQAIARQGRVSAGTRDRDEIPVQRGRGRPGLMSRRPARSRPARKFGQPIGRPAAPNRARNSYFSTLPAGLRGRAGTISSRLGSL